MDIIVTQSMKRYQVLVVELELNILKKIQADILTFSEDIRIYMIYELIGLRSNISRKLP